MTEFRSALRDLRKANNMTQEELSKKLGVSKQVISNWERGYTTSISPEILQTLSRIFNTTAEKILGTPYDPEWQYPPVANRLGNILRKYREKANLSVKAFSHKLGIEENTYTDIESGKYAKGYMLPIELIQQISNVTGYDIDYILGASDHTILPTNEIIRINGIAHPISHIESDFHFKAKFEQLCLENGIHAGNSEANIGITKEQFLAIQLERMPTLSELLRISYAFGVSMDYLIGKTDIRMSTLDADELELILDYRDCSPSYKENIKKRAHDLSISTIREREESVAADEPLGKTGTDMGK